MKIQQFNIEDEKKKNPFRVPEGYMEGLTDQIMARLLEHPQQKSYYCSITYGNSLKNHSSRTNPYIITNMDRFWNKILSFFWIFTVI